MTKEDYLKFHKQYEELNTKVIDVLTRRNYLKRDHNQYVSIISTDFPDIVFYEDHVVLDVEDDCEYIPINFLTDPDTAFAEFEREMEALYQSKLKAKGEVEDKEYQQYLKLKKKYEGD